MLVASCLLLGIVLTVTPSQAVSYNDVLADIYRIANIYDLDAGPGDELEGGARLDGRAAPSWTDNDGNYGDLLNEAQIRDTEFEQHSPLFGYQYMSGGAGEGKQHLTPSGKQDNNKEVKTDKGLPAYCNPPNPCPVGYTADDNCVEDFDNTATHNQKYNAEQKCACDAEHMFHCAAGSKTISTKSTEDAAADTAALGQVIDQLAALDGKGGSMDSKFTGEEERRLKLVAKKSPHLIRKREAIVDKMPNEINPYLAGQHIHRVAKKSPTY